MKKQEARRNKNPGRRPTEARIVAFQVLKAFSHGRFPEESLEEMGNRLDRRDRALASALVYGVLRHKSRLEWLASRYLTKPGKKLDPDVLLILCLGLFQLTDLSRIPARAAVDESVNLARMFGPPWASGLVNAVLRQATRDENQPDPMSGKMADEKKTGPGLFTSGVAGPAVVR